MKKFRLTLNMDLIKIYEAGEFEEFKEAYIQYKKDTNEFLVLSDYFEQKYFKRVNYEYIDEENMSETTRKFLEENHWIIQHSCKDLNSTILVKDTSKLTEDEKYQRFVELANGRLGAIIEPKIRYCKFLKIEDKNAREFMAKYLCKKVRNKKYITLREDAVAAGYQEVVDFIDQHPLYQNEKYNLQRQRIASKLRQIREDKNITTIEFAKLLGIEEVELKKIEKNAMILNNKIVDKYSEISGLPIDELLELDDYKEAYYKTGDYFKAATGIKSY